MKTSKPISTISYNTDEFLRGMLDNLKKARRVEYWCYVKHNGEVQEDGTREKDHKHVLIVPNGKIDTMDIGEMSLEMDPNNVKKPFRCIDFRSSKIDEWFLYCSHDPDYLRTKFLVREFTYSMVDFVSSDEDETEVKWNRAFHESDYMKNQRLLTLMKDHSASQLTANGFVQPQNAFQMQVFYNMLERGKLENENIARLHNQDFTKLKEPIETPFGIAERVLP